jgi:hypothetical protein
MQAPSHQGPAWLDPSQQQQQQQQPQGQAPGPTGVMAVDHEAALFSDSTYSTLNEPVGETIMRDLRAVGEKLKIVLMPLDRTITPFSYDTVAASEAAADSEASPSSDPSNSNQPAAAAGSLALPDQNAMPDAELSAHDRHVMSRLKDWDLWGPLILCLTLAVLLSLKAPTDQASLVFAAVFCSVWAGGTVVTINAQLLGGTISFFQSLCVMGYSMFPLVISAFIIDCLKVVVDTWVWIDLVFVAAGFVWSTRVSAVFISLYVPTERRLLALYPVFFFYTFLGWMILLF